VAETQNQWLDQLGSVLETLNQGVIISDEDRRIIFANSMFLEMGMMSVKDILGRSVMDYIPRMKQAGCRSSSRVVKRRAGLNMNSTYHDPMEGASPWRLRRASYYGADGRAYGIITATDISDQKRIQAELSQTNALLLERQHQMQEELQLAERVQQSLAPKGLSWGGVSVEAHYQPASSIGGDYGLVVPGDGRLDVVVCDVSGHGISSALVANRIYSETMAQIERGADLGSMLRPLNHFAVQKLGQFQFLFHFGGSAVPSISRLLAIRWSRPSASNRHSTRKIAFASGIDEHDSWPLRKRSRRRIGSRN
jgi:PAS fold/Stage II sporulation protein E (SpoIIE)